LYTKQVRKRKGEEVIGKNQIRRLVKTVLQKIWKTFLNAM